MNNLWLWGGLAVSIILNIVLVALLVWVYKRVIVMKRDIIQQLSGISVVIKYFDDFVDYTQHLGFDNYDILTNPILVELVNKIGVIRALIARLSGEKEITIDVIGEAQTPHNDLVKNV